MISYINSSLLERILFPLFLLLLFYCQSKSPLSLRVPFFSLLVSPGNFIYFLRSMRCSGGTATFPFSSGVIETFLKLKCFSCFLIISIFLTLQLFTLAVMRFWSARKIKFVWPKTRLIYWNSFYVTRIIVEGIPLFCRSLIFIRWLGKYE